MITSTTLVTLGIPNITSYYSLIAQNFTDGAVKIARERFLQLSQKQRKSFFLHLVDEWEISPDDGMYKFFFEIF